jgi:transcriptional regulator with XRE-family HTH domain
VPRTAEEDKAIRAFGAEVKRRREASRMTIPELAARSGVSEGHVSTVERGIRDPSLATMEKLAAGLGASVGDLLGYRHHLSPNALEAARLFDAVDPDVREGVLALLDGTAALGQPDAPPDPPPDRRRKRPTRRTK